MDIFVPTRGQSIHELLRPASEIWIGGRRRPDARCSEVSFSAGLKSGSAKIVFSGGAGMRAYSLYDAAMCLENDLVEIRVRPWGLIFRGTITARESDHASLTYTALDLGEKLNDIFFPHDYCTIDEVTKARRRAWTVQQIAAEAWQIYSAWKTNHSDDDFLLSIDLDTFPAVIPREARTLGQPLLQGLQQILESVDYRYRLRVDHSEQASVVKAFLLGAGRQRTIIRGLDPERYFNEQPTGPANVGQINRSVDAAGALTHVYAEGDNRILESAFVLAPDWREVADDFEPPEGETLQDYVTVSERNQVIQAPERYTRERIDHKMPDLSTAKAVNPNYRKKYLPVCRRWRVPAIDNTYYMNDDAEHWPELLGEASRQVKLQSELVQTWGGQAQRPFIVYKREGDTDLEAKVKFDGFTIKQSKLIEADGTTSVECQVVEFAQPFVDTVSNILARGGAGSFVAASWDDVAQTSQYAINDAAIDLTAKISAQQITDGCWLLMSESPAAYKVTARDATTITVKGNLTDAGKDGGKGAAWIVVNVDPHRVHGASGTGATGNYYYAEGPGTEEDLYAGMFLVLGEYDDTTFSPVTPFKDLKCYRVAYDKISSGTRTLWLDKPTADLAGANANWALIQPTLETKRPFATVCLNAAWQSLQKLAWLSGDLSTMRNKRVVYKGGQDYKWTTEFHNFRLIKSEEPGQTDKYIVIYNEGSMDARKDLAALGAWAANQIQGAQNYEIRYQVAVRPIDFGMMLGDQLVDTQFASGATVTGLRFDLDTIALHITAVSRD